nr:hypothetical protein [Candidatus Sigynarchaeota archaeon]
MRTLHSQQIPDTKETTLALLREKFLNSNNPLISKTGLMMETIRTKQTTPTSTRSNPNQNTQTSTETPTARPPQEHNNSRTTKNTYKIKGNATKNSEKL